MDGHESQNEEKMSYRPTRLAKRWCATTSVLFRGLLTRVDRFSSRKISTRNKPPRVQSVPIPLYWDSKVASRCVSTISTIALNTNILPNIVHRAPDDIQNSDKIRSLLKDIREARQAKSREGLQKIDHSELSVRNNFRHPLLRLHHHQQLPNLCSMEINEIRPFFVRAMGVLTQLTRDPAADSRQFDV